MWLDRCCYRLLAFLGPVYSSIRSPPFRQAAVRYLIITMRHVDSPFTAQCELRNGDVESSDLDHIERRCEVIR